MIDKAEFMDIRRTPTAEKVVRLYEEIMGSGDKGFEMRGIYKNACHLCAREFMKHNDYIHANNVMQRYKSDLYCDANVTDKWFICLSISLYGKRTPMYFIKGPDKLFAKVIGVYTPISGTERSDDKKALQNKKYNILLLSVVNSLFEYFYEKFAARNRDDYRTFCHDVNTHFAAYASKFMDGHPEMPTDLWAPIRKLIKYCSDPDRYEVLYVPNDDDCDDIIDDEISYADKRDNNVSLIDYITIGGIALPAPEYTRVDGMRLAILGGDSEAVEAFRQDITAYGLKSVEHYKYDKISSVDINKRFYNNYNYMGIIAGESPHRGKGTEGATSIVSCLESEGYPPTKRACSESGNRTTLKVTRHSLLIAFAALLNEPGNLSASNK